MIPAEGYIRREGNLIDMLCQTPKSHQIKIQQVNMPREHFIS